MDEKSGVRNGRKAVSIILIVVFVLACAFLIVANVRNDDFFSANAVEITTILFGGFITFYLTERMNDKRRRNDCIEHVIMEIEGYITDDEIYKINKNALLKQASCANRIKYLRDASFKDIQKDIEFIDTHFSFIRDLYSEHKKSQDDLDAVKKDINKHRDLIVDKCCKIRIGMYGK